MAQENEAGNMPESLTVDRVVSLQFVEQADKELDKRDDLQDALERVTQLVARYVY